mmetsp:Transcript_117035/g.331217  ORF Transcript_117035/g.331217 Transcript_117035/m.331217 type:complete len:212 (-) Transcript_117035:2-637(-)
MIRSRSSAKRRPSLPARPSAATSVSTLPLIGAPSPVAFAVISGACWMALRSSSTSVSRWCIRTCKLPSRSRTRCCNCRVSSRRSASSTFNLKHSSLNRSTEFADRSGRGPPSWRPQAIFARLSSPPPPLIPTPPVPQPCVGTVGDAIATGPPHRSCNNTGMLAARGGCQALPRRDSIAGVAIASIAAAGDRRAYDDHRFHCPTPPHPPYVA